ncbi:hypothetical protein Cpir12675_002451 [Ceratocystis pirilliformis]|uniref:Long-chain-alcohol oxidase n=1 Tax=Ceratocystis pirilliformis TaxID=259994 RepID=A0ABR3ZAY4_9PEZI
MANLVPSPSDLPDPSPAVDSTLHYIIDAATLDVICALVDTVLPGIRVSTSEAETDGNANQDTETRESLVISRAEFDALYADAKKNRSHFSSKAELVEFLAEKPVDNGDIVNSVCRAIEGTGPKQAKKRQGLASRQRVFKSWNASYFSMKRQVSKAFLMLAQRSYLQNSTLYAKTIGFTPVPPHYVKTASYPFEFVQFDSSRPDVIHTDIVIVGSGPGGGVCAKILSEAGYDVTVVDKGFYYPSQNFPLSQAQGEHHLFENQGAVMSTSSKVTCIAGSCWGGGGTVNWGVSLRTQDYVRREWAEADKLPFYTSKDYDACMDAVWEAIGATTDYDKGPRGPILLEGAQKLGYKAEYLALNTGHDKTHYCGRCHLGCGSNSKQGPMTAWLPQAAKNGARFVEGFQVDRVLFGNDGKTAVGVEGVWKSRNRSAEDNAYTRANPIIGTNLHVHPASTVIGRFDREIIPWEGPIMSSIMTSLENQDGSGHGIKVEPSCSIPFTAFICLPWYTGTTHRMNLAKLPTLAPYVVFARERDPGSVTVDPLTGRPEVNYTPSPYDTHHILKGILATARIVYTQGAREIIVGIPNLPPFIRDDAEREDRSEPVYNGEETSLLGSNAPKTVAERADAAFEAWLNHVESVGINGAGTPWLTAHQMGTCRMSGIESKGVVDPAGRVYGYNSMYVADASILPSASGVNPMVSIMATALHISKGMVQRLQAEDDRTRKSCSSVPA